MHELPRGTPMGHLSIGKVLEYYDFPRLFTCVSSTGQSYVALSTYDDDTEAHWLYLPVSSLRLEALLSGVFPLRDAFSSPEGGYLLQVTSSVQGGSQTSFLLPEQVGDDDLPMADYTIKADAEQAVEVTHSRPGEVATATRRETFDYRIFAGRPASHEVPARKLGGILTSTQELIDSLGQSTLGQATIRGPIAGDILQLTKMNVAHSFRGSFGVQFRASQSSDLFGESTVAAAIQELAFLIQAQDSEDMLSNKLHALKGRVASKYRRLLKELADIGSGLWMEWGSVNADRGGQFELSPEQVKRAYAIVDRIDVALAQEVTITGKLIAFNSRTMRYEILSGDDGRAYAGKVGDDASLESNLVIGQFYEADLRMLVETQSTSGDELIRWVLVRLSASTAAKTSTPEMPVA